MRPRQRVYSHNLLELRPCQPASLVSPALRFKELPFHIAVELLQADPVAIDPVIAVMPYHLLVQGFNSSGDTLVHMLP